MDCDLILSEAKDCFWQMAADEYFALTAKQPLLRIYTWKKPSVSLGFNQSLSKEINTEFCKNEKIPIVRRITGGKAVFHDNDVTYSFIVPKKTELLATTVTESYRQISEALTKALGMLGVQASVEEEVEKKPTPVCFASSNWFELKAHGKKIAGSAQRRLDTAVLQHGSILRTIDYEKNAQIFSTNEFRVQSEQLEQSITCIKNITNSIPDFSTCVAALVQGFEKTFDVQIKQISISKEDLEAIQQLADTKYATAQWTTLRDE